MSEGDVDKIIEKYGQTRLEDWKKRAEMHKELDLLHKEDLISFIVCEGFGLKKRVGDKA